MPVILLNYKVLTDSLYKLMTAVSVDTKPPETSRIIIIIIII